MPIFKIWRRASKDVSIEGGCSAAEACRKTGWRIEECEVQAIPEEQVVDLYGARPAR